MVQLMPLHPKTLSSLASFKSRLVLPLWYRLTQVVLENRPLNGCSVAVVVPWAIKFPGLFQFSQTRNPYRLAGKQSRHNTKHVSVVM